MPKPMTSEEAERRVTTILLLGGTPEERVYALKRWQDAMRREWYEQRSTEKREIAQAIR